MVGVLTLLASTYGDGRTTPQRQLTFEERVLAQEAIDRVYYSHQIGATRPFEEAEPHQVLETKVRTYLKRSVALEEFWQTPVTAHALERELGRIASGTRFPSRLREIYEVLGNDSFLIQECFVRPLLVDRLTRNFLAADERLQGPARRRAENLREQLEDGHLSHVE